MTPEHKQNWICPRCKSELPKGDNSNTPVRQQDMNKNPKNNYDYDENLYITHRNQAGTPKVNETLLDMSIDIQGTSNVSILGNTETENQKLRKEIEEIKAQKPQKLSEDHSKKIMIYGLNEYYGETEEELHDRVIAAFREILNVNLIGYIESTTRIGRKGNRRPLAVEILSKCMTKYLIENKEFFKNTGLAIAEYLDDLSITKRKKLLEILKMERNNGNHAIIRDNVLYINGKKYVPKPENEEKKEEPIKQHFENPTEKSLDEEKEKASSFRTRTK
ncbi:hypothetical protein O0L34_g19063 [Tuta absoluta]|nr:hypothetical protein O0L34_g19063 [Tuta absoluta]